MNKNRLLADAKNKALSLSKAYKPPEPFTYQLPGKTAKVLMDMATKAFRIIGKATEYDVVISGHLAHILSGGDCDLTEPLTENDMLTLELEAFVALVKQKGTLDRLDHMLKTGKPLRN